MEKSEYFNIISDSPLQDKLNFGFDGYAKTLAETVANQNNMTPFTIGIYGPWGSGKTTLMRKIKQQLDDEIFYQMEEDQKSKGKESRKKKDRQNLRRCKTIWFQAWKYSKEEEVLAGLIEEILRTVKKDKRFLTKVSVEIDKLIARFDKSRAIGLLLKQFTNMDTSKFIKDPEYKKKVGYYDTFHDFFERIIWSYIKVRPKFHSNEEPDDKKGALVIFIDDLDRCAESKIIEVLEAIKLFMDKTGCVFVLGAADSIIHKALKQKKLSDMDAEKFLDKIVQVTFTLPPVTDDEFEGYIHEIIGDKRFSKITGHLSNMLTTTHRNIRELKRFINDILLMEAIHRDQKTGISFHQLFLWRMIEIYAPEIKKETIHALWQIQKGASRMPFENGEKITTEKNRANPFIREQSLLPYFDNHTIISLFQELNLSKQQMQQVMTISEVVRSETSRHLSEEDDQKKIVHAIQEKEVMVTIRDKPFSYGKDKIKSLIGYDYEMDVYPVTNSQFAAFIGDDGYKRDELWSPAGIAFKEKEKRKMPDYWKEHGQNKPDHPVVGITCFEACAYARWAKKRLPTEKEWERAARGKFGRSYPWQGTFDKKRCNTQESGHRTTTPVQRYPGGISPEGCYDMAGNVSEWTIHERDIPEEKADVLRVIIKGGSWCTDKSTALLTRGIESYPSYRNDNLGFRCARDIDTPVKEKVSDQMSEKSSAPVAITVISEPPPKESFPDPVGITVTPEPPSKEDATTHNPSKNKGGNKLGIKIRYENNPSLKE